VPIKFTGVGEKIGSLDIFYPERMADRILGFGDIASLAEKASEVMDEAKTKKSLARMLAGKMDLEDLMQQMKQLAKMGSAGGIMKMLPNMPKVSEQQVSDAETRLQTWNIILSSMTLKERRNPILFKKFPNRKNRVIKGSGRRPDELNKMLSE
jgi:signal recognition particle subunit SRP54